MTSLVFWLILWAITAPTAYIIARHVCRDTFGKWTQLDRLFWMTLCLVYGPIVLSIMIVCGLVSMTARTGWDDREARW